MAEGTLVQWNKALCELLVGDTAIFDLVDIPGDAFLDNFTPGNEFDHDTVLVKRNILTG